jgi:hypothetical protein
MSKYEKKSFQFSPKSKGKKSVNFSPVTKLKSKKLRQVKLLQDSILYFQNKSTEEMVDYKYQKNYLESTK